MWRYAKPDQCLSLTYIYQISLFATYNCCVQRGDNETWSVRLWIFARPLSLWSVFLSFCLKLLVRSDVCFCNIAQVSWVREFFCVGLKFNYLRFWLLNFSLEQGNLVDGGLAGSVAGVWQFRSGLWKWQMPQQWHWFSARRYISFSLQQI